MAEFEAVRSVTLTLGATVAQGRFVEINSAGKAIQGAAAANDVVGVSLEAGILDEVIPVALMDGAKVRMEAGAAVTLGAALNTDSVGRCVDDAGVLARIQGYALEAAAGVGEFITVLLAKGSGNTPAS